MKTKSKSPIAHFTDDNFKSLIFNCEQECKGVTIEILREYLKKQYGIEIGMKTLRKELNSRKYSYKEYGIVPKITPDHKLKRLPMSIY